MATNNNRPAIALMLVAITPLLLMPLVAVFIFAARGGADQFFAIISSAEAQFAVRYSLLIACLTALINSVLGVCTAYALSRFSFRGRNALGVLVNLPVAIPTVVVGTSLLLLWGPIGLIGRYLDPLGIQPMFSTSAIVLAHIFVTFPYLYGTVRPVLDELDATYEEAAYTMGATRMQTFFWVVLPAIRSSMLSGALLTFAHSIGEFGATVLVSGNLRFKTQTAPLYIFAQFEAGNIEAASAVSAVLALFSFALFYLLLKLNRVGLKRNGLSQEKSS